jgi:hypothetical protein
MQHLSPNLHRYHRDDFLPQAHPGTRDPGNLGLLAEGSLISLSRAKGHKEDTILAWLREASQHADQVEEVLMADFQVKMRPRPAAPCSALGNAGGIRMVPRRPLAMVGVASTKP